MAQCLAQFSDHAVRRSEYDVAEKMYNRIIPVFIGLGDRASTAHCLEWLSDVAREREDYKQAGEFCIRAITAYQEATAHGQLADGIDSTKIELGLADALWSQGELRRLEQQWNEASANYKSAYLYFELHHSLRGQANCFRGLGYVALGRTDHVGALTFFLRAQKIYEEIGLPLGHGKCLYGIGKLHHSRREFDLALRHYEPALNFFQRLRNGRLVELCRARIAAAQNSEDVSNIQL